MKLKFGLILFIVILLRTSVWLLPMQRDAVGYAYIGKEVARGAVPYRDVWDHKPPGVYVLNAFVYTLFPTLYVPALLATSLLAALLSSILLFFLLRFFFSVRTSWVATVLFSIFSNIYVLTVGDNLIEGHMLPILIGFYFLFIHALRTHKPRFYIFSGILLGILFLFKQVGILPIFSCIFYLVWRKQFKAWKEILYICIGVLLALAPVAIYFWHHQALHEAFDAIFIYNVYYSKQGYDFRSLGQSAYYSLQVILATLLFWYFAVIGFFKKGKIQTDVLFVLFFLTSFVGVAMGGRFAFTRHYFLLIYPTLAYFAAKALEAWFSRLRKDRFLKMSASMAIVALILPSLIVQSQAALSGLYFRGLLHFKMREAQYLLGMQNYNFVEEEKIFYRITAYLKQRVGENDVILDWGAEQEIYMLTNAHALTRYFYNFPLNGTFITHDPLRESRRIIFMKELEKNNPIYIVGNKEETLHQPSFQELDFPAFKEFLMNNYVIETTIDNFIIWKRKIPLA